MQGCKEVVIQDPASSRWGERWAVAPILYTPLCVTTTDITEAIETRRVDSDSQLKVSVCHGREAQQ